MRLTKQATIGVALATAFIGFASTAAAATLSTGVGALGSNEVNWALSTGDPLYIVSGPALYPAGTWVTAPTGSNWITPVRSGTQAASAPDSPPLYTYELAFANPWANVYIQWSSDNGATFFLNGDLLSAVGPTGYSGLTSFSILAAAFEANNTFTVIVSNDACPPCTIGNPTGLLVSATATPIPVPAALPLLASGVGGLLLLNRRRKAKANASAEG